MALDLASFQSIRSFAAAFLERKPNLHVLINNAGLMLSDRRTTEEGFEQTFGVNHLGHFLLTDLLLERIKTSAPARIVTVASEAHRVARRGLYFKDLHATTTYTAGSSCTAGASLRTSTSVPNSLADSKEQA